MEDIDKVLKEIDEAKSIDYNKSFELVKLCSIWLRNRDKDILARRMIIHVLNKWNEVSEDTRELWVDLIEACGFYPYILKNQLPVTSTFSKLRYLSHQSENIANIYFHEEQKILINLLNSDKNIIVSAPTSFGKSLLIEDIVASKKYKNIVVIQPTLALLDETRKKLKQYQENYKIIVRTSQRPNTIKGNLFLLTAERVMEYEDLPKINLLILDEFYKLSEKRPDERSDVLNNAFHFLLKRDKVKFYLLGPNIKGISQGFTEKYNALFCRTDYSLVDNNVIDLYSEEYGPRNEAKVRKENALFELLFELKHEQTIIYCSSPFRARYLAKKFMSYLKEKISYSDNNNLNIIEWIEKNVDKDWCLIDCLKNHIGFHDGALQKHITSSIIKYFNLNKLNFLFCTSTIIEGVNTSAKNVVIFDNWKGNYRKTNFIDYFDYSNIKGRAGRLMIHYLGNIYNFNQVPKQEDLVVDIPFFEQKPIKDEVLIHLDDSEVIDKNSSQYKELNSIPKEERDIFKKNGVLVKGQKKILDKLREDFQIKKHLFIWSGLPKYNQLKYVLDLGWDNLLKPTETTRPMSKKKLVKVTFDYGIEKSISYLVQSNFRYFKQEDRFPKLSDQDVFDEAIRDAFNILRHWFEYKVPKWLNVISELQKYVCIEIGVDAGDYTFYASQIENDFIRENLAILLEYGIPRTALEKLKNKISSNWSEDEVVAYVKSNKAQYSKDLLKYETEKIEDSL